MSRMRGPLLTLGTVAALALVLLGVNLADQPPAPAPTAAAPAVPTPAGAAVPEPPPPSPVREVAYAGRTAGDEATIAIAVVGDRAVAYLCDGKRTEAWLEGTVDGETLALEGEDGATLAGELRDGAVFGTAQADERSWPFSAALATGAAGTYRGEVSVDGVRTRIGWNVLPDGSVTGIATGPAGPAPAPALDPDALSASLDGVPVTVDRVTGDADVD